MENRAHYAEYTDARRMQRSENTYLTPGHTSVKPDALISSEPDSQH